MKACQYDNNNDNNIDSAIQEHQQELKRLRDKRQQREQEVKTLKHRLHKAQRELEQAQRRPVLSNYMACMKDAYLNNDKQQQQQQKKRGSKGYQYNNNPSGQPTLPPGYILNMQGNLCHTLHLLYSILPKQSDLVHEAAADTLAFLKTQAKRIQMEKPQREIQILNALATSSAGKQELQLEYATLLSKQYNQIKKYEQLELEVMELQVYNNAKQLQESSSTSLALKKEQQQEQDNLQLKLQEKKNKKKYEKELSDFDVEEIDVEEMDDLRLRAASAVVVKAAAAAVSKAQGPYLRTDRDGSLQCRSYNDYEQIDLMSRSLVSF